MIIAYQGEQFSNSEIAAKEFVLQMKFEDVNFVPMRTSGRVVDLLVRGVADYGVLAIKNSFFGEVLETKNAMEGISYVEHKVLHMPIHHCLFSGPNKPQAKKLTQIYSHVQALGQCKATLAEIAPNASLDEAEDTAFAAKQLGDGNYSELSGVLCRREAGEANGLFLLKENVEDSPNNVTSFVLISLN